MSDPRELFAIELGRAAKASRNALTGLKGADRDDAIAAAMLEAWERKSEAPEKLDAWFALILGSAVRHIKRSTRSRSYSAMKLDEIAGCDSTSESAEAAISAEQLAKRLTGREQEVATMLADGYALNRIATTLRMPHSELKKVIRKLRKMNYKKEFYSATARNPYAPPPDSDHRLNAPAPIDHQIEALLRRPATTTSDCPVCWRCMWFEGMTPTHYHPPQLVEPDVQAAVAAIEARKITIGNGGTV